jgi:hypothetical protein
MHRAGWQPPNERRRLHPCPLRCRYE